MCIIRDKDQLHFECKGTTVGEVKQDISTNLSVSTEHVSLYALTQHGLNLDAAEDTQLVKDTDVFYMEITPCSASNDEQYALKKTPIVHSDVGQSLRECKTKTFKKIPESATLLAENVMESPILGNKKTPADCFCFI